MQIHESAEDYLEAILMLREQNGQVRSIDVVNKLGYTKPSISVAMKRLRENGYIEMDAGGFLTLTEAGEAVATRIYSRHRLLTDFLLYLGVGPETARSDACKIEHDLSDESYEKMRQHVLREREKDAAGEGSPLKK